MIATLALASACTPSDAPPSTRYTRENIGFDVTRDAAVKGQYTTSGTYVDGQGVNPDEVKWRALLNGMEAARPVAGLIAQINGALAHRKM